MTDPAPITIACLCADCRHYEPTCPDGPSECHPCHVRGSFAIRHREVAANYAELWPAPDFGCIHASPKEALVAMLGEIKP